MPPSPNGTPRKLLDVSKAKALGWRYTTELEDGIRMAYEDFSIESYAGGAVSFSCPDLGK